MEKVSSVAFLAGTWLFFDIRELWFIIYAAVYLIIGLVAMGIRKQNETNDLPNNGDAFNVTFYRSD